MKRRRHGEGSVFRRKDGRWEAQIAIGGRSMRRSFYGHSRAEVEQKLRLAINSIEHAGARRSLYPLSSEYLNTWLEHESAATVRPSTLESYRLSARRIEPIIGSARVADLTPMAFQRLYAELLRSGPAPRSIWKIHTVL